MDPLLISVLLGMAGALLLLPEPLAQALSYLKGLLSAPAPDHIPGADDEDLVDHRLTSIANALDLRDCLHEFPELQKTVDEKIIPALAKCGGDHHE